jgi:hypothetical protein
MNLRVGRNGGHGGDPVPCEPRDPLVFTATIITRERGSHGPEGEQLVLVWPSGIDGHAHEAWPAGLVPSVNDIAFDGRRESHAARPFG